MALPHNMFDVAERKRLTPQQRAKMFLDHKGICVVCAVKILPERGDKWIDEHIIRLADWGDRPGDPNGPDNRGPAHEHCARDKTSKEARTSGKLRRQGMRHMGIKKESKWGSRPIAGSKASGWKRPMNGPARRRTEND
jgi:5-methylcytosine-specific restriction enzyme A